MDHLLAAWSLWRSTLFGCIAGRICVGLICTSHSCNDDVSSGVPSNAENQAAIAQAGGIPAVVAALRGHPTSAGVQKWGAAALAKLGAGELAPHAEATNSCFTRF